MKKYFYYLELISLLLIATCGVFLIIGGLFMNTGISVFIGFLALIFPLIIFYIEKK